MLGESSKSFEYLPSPFQWFLDFSKYQICRGNLYNAESGAWTSGFDTIGLGWMSGIFIFDRCSSLVVVLQVVSWVSVEKHQSVVCSPPLFPPLPCASAIVPSRRKGVSEGEDLIHSSSSSWEVSPKTCWFSDSSHTSQKFLFLLIPKEHCSFIKDSFY